MKIDVITIFPKMFDSPFAESIVKRAIDKGIVEINFHDLRKWTADKRRTVDDKPYGGGAGMVMMVEPIYKAIKELKSENSHVIITSAKGETYKQNKAVELSKKDHLIIICGHYEGIDHRVYEHLADEVISIGSYVLTGGELPAMVIVDSVVRLKQGSLGNEESLQDESYSDENNEKRQNPEYTRPEVFETEDGEKWEVPKVLLSGNHAEIDKWKVDNQS